MHTAQTRIRRLRRVATLLQYAVLAFVTFWSYLLLDWAIPVIFTDAIHTHRFVETGAEVTVLMRVIYGGLWLSVLVAGWVGAAFAVRMSRQIRAGHYFTDKTARDIKWLGLSLVAAMICDTILAAFGHSVLTWGNAPKVPGLPGSIGYVPPSYYFDSGDITVMLCGIGFFLVGWLLQEGGRIEAENRGFV